MPCHHCTVSRRSGYLCRSLIRNLCARFLPVTTTLRLGDWRASPQGHQGYEFYFSPLVSSPYPLGHCAQALGQLSNITLSLPDRHSEHCRRIRKALTSHILQSTLPSAKAINLSPRLPPELGQDTETACRAVDGADTCTLAHTTAIIMRRL